MWRGTGPRVTQLFSTATGTTRPPDIITLERSESHIKIEVKGGSIASGTWNARYRLKNTDDDWKDLNNTTEVGLNKFRTPTLFPDTEYEFEAWRGVDSNPRRRTYESTLPRTVVVIDRLLDPPTGLFSYSRDRVSISVYATPVVGATSYSFQLAEDEGFTTGLVTREPVNSLMTFMGLTAGTTYYIRVATVNAKGTGRYSRSITIPTVAVSAPPPTVDPPSDETPPILSVVTRDQESIEIQLTGGSITEGSWNARYRQGTGNWTDLDPIGTGNPNIERFKASGLTSNLIYTFEGWRGVDSPRVTSYISTTRQAAPSLPLPVLQTPPIMSIDTVSQMSIQISLSGGSISSGPWFARYRGPNDNTYTDLTPTNPPLNNIFIATGLTAGQTVEFQGWRTTDGPRISRYPQTSPADPIEFPPPPPIAPDHTPPTIAVDNKSYNYIEISLSGGSISTGLWFAQVRDTNTNIWKALVPVSREKPNIFRAIDLEAGHSYEFHCKRTASGPTASLTTDTTSAEAPSIAFSNVMNTSMTCTLSELVATSGPWFLRYKQDGTSTWISANPRNQGNQYFDLSGLTRATLYNFQASRGLEGEWSESVDRSTTGGINERVVFTLLTDQTVTATPTDFTDVGQYMLQYRQRFVNAQWKILGPQDSPDFLIDDLFPLTSYEFQGSKGESGWLPIPTQKLRTNQSTAILYPPDLIFDSILSNSITFRVVGGSVTTGTKRAYYRIKDSGNDWTEITADPVDPSKFTASGLQSTTPYEFQAKQGIGPTSLPQERTTGQDTVSLSFSNKATTTVTVTLSDISATGQFEVRYRERNLGADWNNLGPQDEREFDVEDLTEFTLYEFQGRKGSTLWSPPIGDPSGQLLTRGERGDPVHPTIRVTELTFESMEVLLDRAEQGDGTYYLQYKHFESNTWLNVPLRIGAFNIFDITDLEPNELYELQAKQGEGFTWSGIFRQRTLKRPLSYNPNLGFADYVKAPEDLPVRFAQYNLPPTPTDEITETYIMGQVNVKGSSIEIVGEDIRKLNQPHAEKLEGHYYDFAEELPSNFHVDWPNPARTPE